jgi:hypothetical protein
MNQEIDAVDVCLNLILVLQKLKLGVRHVRRTPMAFELAILLDEGKEALTVYRKEHNWWG